MGFVMGASRGFLFATAPTGNKQLRTVWQKQTFVPIGKMLIFRVKKAVFFWGGGVEMSIRQ